MIWLLVLFVGLQGVSVGVAKAKGPAHVHLEPARIFVLDDVRRSHHGVASESMAEGWLNHSHQVAIRHHHASADPTVVLEAAGAADKAAEDGALSLDLVVAAFIALLMLAFCWAPAQRSQGRALHSLWQPSFATARLLDRPPQLT